MQDKRNGYPPAYLLQSASAADDRWWECWIRCHLSRPIPAVSRSAVPVLDPLPEETSHSNAERRRDQQEGHRTPSAPGAD